MSGPLDDDYLMVVGAIAARITAEVPDVSVEPVENVQQAVEHGVSTPTAFVLWEGDRFTDTQGNGKGQLVYQSFTVLLAVRNADQIDKDARNDTAGPLLSRLHRAVAGWQLGVAGRAFKRVNSPRRPLYKPNVGLYPLTFEILLTL